MMRRTWIGFAALAVGLAGCFDGFLTDSTTGFRNRPVEVPDMPEASIAAAARVDQVGRQLITQNPFLGIDPTFHTFGRKEPEIFHPDLGGVFVTDGLVERCKTDDELAAVLATELAKMSHERRARDRLLRSEPLRTNRDAGALTPGGIASDQNQLGMQALVDRQAGNSEWKPGQDGNAGAREILVSAGIDPKVLQTVEPVLREAGQHHALADHLGRRAEPPRWTN